MTSHEDWEDKFIPTRREMRLERKIQKRADTSKYKHTDQQKRKISAIPEGFLLGKVIYIRSQDVDIAADGAMYTCSLKGSFKLEKNLKKNLLVVGDDVYFDPTARLIHHIAPRKSVLCRQDHFHRLMQHLVAANVDQVLITLSVAEPALKLSIIDRYVIAAHKGNLAPVLIINKSDLAPSYPVESSLAQECLQIYPRLGIPTLIVCARTEGNFEALRTILQNKVSVFSGQSGAGKTLIINKLTGLDLKVGSIRAVGKGAHTTTSAKLLQLPFGGWCVDTPGIRSFGIFNLEKNDLKEGFPDLFEKRCAFTDCWHIGEQGCSIPQGVQEGSVSPHRLASYHSLLTSLGEERLRI